MANLLTRINRASLKFLAPLTLEEVYSVIIDEVTNLMGAEHASILLQQKRKLVRVAASSSVLYSYEPRRKGNLVRIFKTGVPFVANAEETIKVHPELGQLNVKSILHIPLSYGKKSVGILTVYASKKEKFNQQELRTLKLFGSTASLAIRKSQLYEETKKALDLRDQFISVASHEFRTPLTSINGYIQMLYDKNKELRSPEAELIRNLYLETIRLTSLVTELLDINRIKTGQLAYLFKECSLVEIIERSIKNISFTNNNRLISFKNQLKGVSDLVVGDHDKLLQAINNILDNAVKFTPINKKIHLSLYTVKSFFIIKVEDQGGGINKKELGYVFESFYKGKSHTKEGMGIGLFLVKNIVETHHGSVVLYSKEAVGTTVEIKLPRLKND